MQSLGDLKFVVLSLLGLFVAWAIFGSNNDVGGPFIKPPAPISSGETYGGNNDNGSSTDQASSSILAVGQTGVKADLRDLATEFKRIESLANSKYKGQIEITNFGGAKQSLVDKEILEIKVVGKNVTTKINITGWRLESAVSGIGDSIEGGTYLPYSGQVNSESGIFLEAGDKVIVSSGRSPIGTSFRLNKCTGYFEQFQDFTPAIPKTCPKAIDDLPDFGVGDEFERCVEFVKKMPTCEVYLKSVPVNMGGACHEYITSKVNYNSCVSNHKDDPNFYTKEWRVYLGRNSELWKSKREIIKLLDSQGKIVDVVTY
jgi:hypothetical protein